MPIVNRIEARIIAKKWRDNRKKIVFTNGCFDILHRGHVEYLRSAKLLGDVLIIGLNSNESVQRLKGNPRPHQNQKLNHLKKPYLTKIMFIMLFGMVIRFGI